MLLSPKSDEQLRAMRAHVRGLVRALRHEDSSVSDAARAVLHRRIEEHPAYLGWAVGFECAPFHWDALTDALTHSTNLWLAPRGSGKSTVHAVLFPAWLAIADPDLMHPEIQQLNGGRGLFPDAPRAIGPWSIRVALVSNSHEKAVALHNQVKSILERPVLRQVFGAPLQGSRWRDETSFTRFREHGRDPLPRVVYGSPPLSSHREGTFTALGLGSKVTGGHYDVVVADDCVTEDNARTQTQRETLERWWKLTVAPTREPWARTVVCGTRYHPADWYGTLQEDTERETAQGKAWGHVRRTPALVSTDGSPCDFEKPDTLRSYWPHAYTVEKLLHTREELGPTAFDTQYQNVTDRMLGGFFDREHLEQFERFEELPEGDRAKARTFIACDPATAGGKKRDFTAVAVVSYVAPYWYVRECVRGQFLEEELRGVLKALVERYAPRVLGFEVAGSGMGWFFQRIARELRSSRTLVKALAPTRHIGSKEQRASYVRPYFEKRCVKFAPPMKGNGIARLLEELSMFPNAQGAGQDDCVDALVWALLCREFGGTRGYRLPNRSALGL